MTLDMKRRLYKHICGAALMLFCLVLETTLLSSLRVFGATPRLVPFLVACIALLEDTDEGMTAALIGGFLCDALYSSHEGFYIVLLPLLALGICIMNKLMYWKNYGMAVLDWVVLIFLFHTVHFGIYMLAAGKGSFMMPLRLTASEMIATLPFTPFLYIIQKKILNHFDMMDE